MEGLGRFACETLKRITVSKPEHEFIFIFDRKFSDEFIFSKNITPVTTFPPARHPLLWYLFFDWGIPPVLRKYEPDLFLSPDGWLSLRTDVPSLPVIHDLNFFYNKEWVEKLPGIYYNIFFPKFIRKAKRVATVSQFSANDIASRFGISPDKIDVVYNGSVTNLMPVDDPVIRNTRNRYTHGKPYFLFLGLVHPRKNLTRIIDAFNIYKRRTNDNTCLLVAGSTKYMTSDTRNAYENSPFRENIIFSGRLPEDELPQVLGSARALIYTSLFEGFGIPIIEAMSCAVPVLTSDVTSMPEVGGKAVYYADPYSADSIAEGMYRLQHDKVLREDLVKKGMEQKNIFSWDRTAGLLWKSMESALSAPDL